MSRALPRIRALGGSIRPWQRDLVLSLTLGAASLVELLRADDVGNRWIAAAAALACTLGLLMRRTRPVAVAIGVAAVLVVASALGAPPESIGVLLAVVVATYSVACERPLRPALLGAGAITVGIAAAIVRDPTDSAWNIPPTLLLFVVIPFAAGLALRDRARRAAREALAIERSRIARELHDVVAHGVSLIALQADAAAAALDHAPERARPPVEAIAVTAREALAELRRLLEVVRGPEDDDPRAPRPGVGRLPDLVESVRRAGMAVDMTVEGSADPLGAGVDLAVFRVAQEALTNALRHSGMARVAVTLRYRPAEIQIEISDDGRPPAALTDGFGLIGMRERVELYGGSLVAGPRQGGGYRVLATMPR